MKVIYTKNGKGYLSPKINISNKILKTINITQEEPFIDLYYSEGLNCIIIKKATK